MTKVPEEKRNILDEDMDTLKDQGGGGGGGLVQLAIYLSNQVLQNVCNFTDPVSGGSEANGFFGKII